MDRPTASPVPVWLFDEQQARMANAAIDDSKRPAERDFARRLFHASFRRIA